MPESKQKNSGPTRKQAILISSAILLVAAGIAGFLLWQAKTPEHNMEKNAQKDAGEIDFEPRNDPVLMIPGPDATEEERAEYEGLVQNRTQQTGTLYVEDCQTHPMVAKMVSEAGLRIANEGDKSRTLIFEFGKYEIPANSSEYINIVNDGGRGMHYYGCDIPLTTGIIIAEDFEFEI